MAKLVGYSSTLITAKAILSYSQGVGRVLLSDMLSSCLLLHGTKQIKRPVV